MRTGGCPWVLALTLGCGATVDVIDHTGGGDGSGTQADAPDPEELMDRNFPEPALTVCGLLPPGVAPIADLATARVVTGPRNPTATEAPVASSVPRLRLASFGLEADASIGDVECDGEGWMLGLDLVELAPGVYPLAELVESYPEGYERYESPDGEDGCGYGSGWGTMSTPATYGELEIFAVTDSCVMGELRGTMSGPQTAFPLRDGGFVAERAAVACVPMLDLSCG